MPRKKPRLCFTLLEILIVIVIIAIAAMIAVPVMSSAGNMQVRSAVNMIAADLEYAKSMAITRQKTYSVVFNAASETYQIEDSAGVIEHPVKKGFNYVINFTSDSRLNKVDIVSVDFNEMGTIKFDYLGSPFVGAGAPLNSGAVVLRSGATTITISVEPVTGFISITD